MPARTPNKVDEHIASRVRDLRVDRKLTQETLGVLIGVTFQQVQKYERATNRISASRLYEIATRLAVPVAYFFDGLSNGIATRGFAEGDASPYLVDDGGETQEERLLAGFRRIADRKVRESVVTLVEAQAASK